MLFPFFPYSLSLCTKLHFFFINCVCTTFVCSKNAHSLLHRLLLLLGVSLFYKLLAKPSKSFFLLFKGWLPLVNISEKFSNNFKQFPYVYFLSLSDRIAFLNFCFTLKVVFHYGKLSRCLQKKRKLF